MSSKKEQQRIMKELSVISTELGETLSTRTQCESNQLGSVRYLKFLIKRQKELEDARDRATDTLERLGAQKDY